jgi:hypothetical protein
MKRVLNMTNSSFRWRRRAIAAAALALVASCVLFVTSAMGDAGNPILGTIKGKIVSTPMPGYPDAVTVYVRGQWNWLSHNSDCNFDRAAAGVGIIWNDPNGPNTSPAVNEVQRVALQGTVTGGTFTLKFNNQTTAAIAYNADAATMDQRLEALSTIGSGNVSVSKPSSTQWDVTFVGALAGQNIAGIQVGSKSLTGSGANVNVTVLTTGVPAVYNGFLISQGSVSAYVGTKDATTLDPIDRMAHPVDRGNQIEGYTQGTWQSTTQGYAANANGDYPQGQQFADPAPPQASGGAITNTQVNAWKGGCGREPLTATPSKVAAGPGGEPTGLSCSTGTTECSGHPWGSWGYEKNGGLGYSHVYRSRSDVTTVCANFYDVHGGGTFSSGKFQLVNGTNEITIDANGDNSIKTNAFNTMQGANCISFGAPPPISLTTTATASVTIGGSIKDTATLSNGTNPGGTITFKVYAPHADGSADPTCSNLVATLPAVNVNGNGSYDSPPFTPTGTSPQIAGTYEWIASYSGDGTNPASTGKCGDAGEQSLVNKYTSTMQTQQSILLSDYAKVSSSSSSSGTPTGSVTFQLFTSNDCSTGKIFDSGAVALDSGGLANAAYPTPLTANGTYSWLVSFTATAGSIFAPSSSACGSEKTTISGNTPGIIP